MQREDRYIVIKKSDIESAIQSNDLTKQEAWNLKIIARFVGHSRERRGQKPLQCVVVESDWPEYEPVWNMIAARVDDHNASNGVTAVPGGPNSTVLRDYARYQFLRDKDAFGAENEPGLVGWDELTDLAGDEFDAAIDARMAHPDIAYTVPPAEVIAPRSAILERNPKRLASLACDEEHLKNLMMLWSENTLIHHLAARLLAVLEASKPITAASDAGGICQAATFKPAIEPYTLLQRLCDWDIRYPVNCQDGYAGLKALDAIIADARAMLEGKPDGK